MLHRTLQFHNVTSRVLKKGELPIHINHPKSGSDLLVTTNGLKHVDVKVSNGRNNSTHKYKYRKTIKHYANFTKSTGIVTIPFVMTLFGTFAPATLTDIDNHLIGTAHQPMELRKAIHLNCQMELFRSLTLAFTLATLTTQNVTAAIVKQDLIQSDAVVTVDDVTEEHRERGRDIAQESPDYWILDDGGHLVHPSA